MRPRGGSLLKGGLPVALYRRLGMARPVATLRRTHTEGTRCTTIITTITRHTCTTTNTISSSTKVDILCTKVTNTTIIITTTTTCNTSKGGTRPTATTTTIITINISTTNNISSSNHRGAEAPHPSRAATAAHPPCQEGAWVSRAQARAGMAAGGQGAIDLSTHPPPRLQRSGSAASSPKSQRTISGTPSFVSGVSLCTLNGWPIAVLRLCTSVVQRNAQP